MKTLLKDAQVVNEGKIENLSILIENDKILKIIPTDIKIELSSDIKIIDCKNKAIIPGIIDTHVHFREPGLTHKADIKSESRAAVAGGVTTYFEMPNTNPTTTSLEQLNKKIEIASQTSLANYGFYIGATNNNIDKLFEIPKEKYCGVKVFMGSSTGDMLVDDNSVLNRLFSKTEKIVVVHCEDEHIVKTNMLKYREKYGEDVPFRCHPEIRNTEACYKSTKRAIELAQKHNTKLHIAHLTTEKELNLLSELSIEDKNVTAEVCVQHLWFDDNDYDKFESRIKCNPAIKSTSDKTALMKGLLDGKIDTIATDHAPHLLSEKEQTYFKSPSGIPIIQHSLLAVLTFCTQDVIKLTSVVEKMCHNPAKIFGISKRGYIREGYYADLVIIDLDSEKTKPAELFHKCGWSAFDGYPFKTRVEKTFVNGILVFDDGVLNETHKGVQITQE